MNGALRVHFVTAELAPLCQSGGLGDAVSGLARALGARGHHVTCVIPAYRDALESPGCPELHHGGEVVVHHPRGNIRGRWWLGELFTGVSVALLDIPSLYDRRGLYGDGRSLFSDNQTRFITLSRAAAYRAEADHADVVVAHDHHAALALAVLGTALDRGRNRGIGRVQVVHNNAYQGRYPAAAFAETGLCQELFHPDALEAYGELCCLKGGLAFADRIVAVSPTYAREVQDLAFGEGLEGMYQARAHRLVGITNGIDTVRFDPSADPSLAAHYDKDRLANKAQLRARVLDELSLSPPDDGLFCVAIARFDRQKGWDVIERAVPGLLELGASLALLGDGDPAIGRRLEELAHRNPGRVFVRASYDDGLARRLYAGGDCVLVPSRFEPCGLVQRIAQRYGTVPVAHAVGGLVDTIHDPAFLGASDDEAMTGVLFSPLSPESLVRAVSRVHAVAEQGRLDALRRRLLELDVSWEASAQAWESLLHDVHAEAKARI